QCTGVVNVFLAADHQAPPPGRTRRWRLVEHLPARHAGQALAKGGPRRIGEHARQEKSASAGFHDGKSGNPSDPARARPPPAPRGASGGNSAAVNRSSRTMTAL